MGKNKRETPNKGTKQKYGATMPRRGRQGEAEDDIFVCDADILVRNKGGCHETRLNDHERSDVWDEDFSADEEGEASNSIPSYSPGVHKVRPIDRQDASKTQPHADAKLSSSSDDELVDDNEIWASTSVDRAEFYAAALVHDCVDTKRLWFKPPYNATPSKTLQARMLDQLALLFARAKTLHLNKGESDSHPCESNSGQNVTATSLWNNWSEKPFIIFVAKNDGPKVINCIGDEDFGTRFSDWFNSWDGEHDDTMWRYIQDFWFHRHRFYVHAIKTTRKRWKNLEIKITGLKPEQHMHDDLEHSPKITISERAKPLKKGAETTRVVQKGDVKVITVADLWRDSAPEEFSTVLRLEGTAQDLFQKDWHHVGTLLKWLDEAHDALLDDEEQLRVYVDRLCFEDDGTWHLSYRKRQVKPNGLTFERLEEDFRKLIKHFKLLRTISTFWHTCKTFRNYGKTRRVLEIRFVPKENVRPIPKLELLKAIKAWEKNATSERASEKLRDTRIRVQNSKHLDRNFHCELQLLQLHPQSLGDARQGHYFGCSKLSCLLCWRLLRGQGFSTKSTHGKLEPHCSFPLQALRGERRIRLAKDIEKIAEFTIRELSSDKSYIAHEGCEFDARSQTTAPSQRLQDSQYPGVTNDFSLDDFGLPRFPESGLFESNAELLSKLSRLPAAYDGDVTDTDEDLDELINLPEEPETKKGHNSRYTSGKSTRRRMEG